MGSTTTPAAAPRGHSNLGTPGITCREGKYAQPHKYGNHKRPSRATPQHHAPKNGRRPGPRRRPGSTTPNITERVHTRQPARGPDTGQPGAIPAPQPASPTDGEPYKHTVRRPSHTDTYPDPRHQRQARATDRHHAPQRPHPHREPLSPGSGGTLHVDPRVPSTSPGTGRTGTQSTPRPTSPTSSTAHGSAIWQSLGPQHGPGT